MAGLIDVTDRVLVRTSDLYMTTTTVIVGADGGCLLVDPAVTPADIAELASDLRRRRLTVVAGFSTHPHWDHVLWSAELDTGPRYATATAVRALATDFTRSLTLAEKWAPGHDPALFGRLIPLDPGETSIKWNGPEVRIIEHRAHAPGHAALHLPIDGVLLVGDMCSDVEIPLLDLRAVDPLSDYRSALRTFAAIDGVRHVVPGHGSVADGAELNNRIAADHAYLDRLESGGGADDPRLNEDWLIEAHREQVESVRAS